MLDFLTPYADSLHILNLFNYLTVRAGGAFLTAFLISILFGQSLINHFRLWQSGHVTVKDILPHEAKIGTPSMGGLLMMGSFLISGLLWFDLSSPYIWLSFFIVLSFGAVGLFDDYLSMTRQWKNGVPGKVRLAVQSILAIGAVWVLASINGTPFATALQLPFVKEWVVYLGLPLFILLGVFVLVGTANAVNLTDGLDGLVSMPAAITLGTFAGLAYITGRVDYTTYLHILYVPGAGEIAVACACMVGSVLGFLWFNAPPARIFMGDTGSLPLGAFMGLVALMIKQEVLLVIVGGVFVMETVSVILKVASFKLTGKRIFKMAPLHHHFEQKGWPESTIVVRFWIIALILAMVGLATLKLR